MEIKLKAPNFIVLGGHKCGTSSLHFYLNQHPDIFMPERKGTDILSHINTLAWESRDVKNLERYQNLFADKKENQIAGEVSSVYFKKERVCQTIKNLFEDVKLLMILRNPVDRAWSNFNVVNTNNTNSKNFNVLENPRMLAKGNYSQYIKMYCENFPDQEIKFLIFEKMVNKQHQQAFFADLFNFLEIDSNFQPDTNVIMRKGGTRTNSSFKKAVFRNNKIRLALGTLLKPFTNSEQRRLLSIKAQNMLTKKVKLAPELRQELINYYREDIFKLQDLIQQDLSHWLR